MNEGAVGSCVLRIVGGGDPERSFLLQLLLLAVLFISTDVPGS
jgi:hypothetical protein